MTKYIWCYSAQIKAQYTNIDSIFGYYKVIEYQSQYKLNDTNFFIEWFRFIDFFLTVIIILVKI